MKRYTNNTPMIDLFLTMALFFLAIAVIQMALIKVENKKKNVESKAEFIITVEWPSDIRDDVDTYLEDPVGNIIFYQKKSAGLMHLDRDDLGHSNDFIKLPNGKFMKFDYNREKITLRGIIPGEYILNLHMFNKRVKIPTKVTVTIEKLNPYSTVFTKSVIIRENGDEITVCRFRLDKSGNVTEINSLQKKFIGRR